MFFFVHIRCLVGTVGELRFGFGGEFSGILPSENADLSPLCAIWICLIV